MFCRNCGKKLNDGDKFCSSCGAKVEDQVVNFSFGSTQEDELGFGLEPKRGPKRSFAERMSSETGRRLMDMDWDLNQYPGKKPTPQKRDTAEVDFNWDTIVKNREESGAYNEPDSIMTEEELFVKLTKDTARSASSPGPSWELGSTARFEKPAGGRGLGPNDFTMPFLRDTKDQGAVNVIDLGAFAEDPEFIDPGFNQGSEFEMDYEGDYQENGYEEFVPFQDDFRPPYREEMEDPYKNEYEEPAQETYMPEYEPVVPRIRRVEPFIAPQEELYEEMNETIQAAESAPQRSPIDKFYTFNKKSEEFKALLDQEYERLKARLEAGKEEEETLAEKRAKLRERAAERERLAMEADRARIAEEERKAQAEAEVLRKAEEEKRLIEEEQRLFAESRALVEEQERLKAEEEARKRAEEEALAALEAAALAALDEKKDEDIPEEEEIPFGDESQQEADETIELQELAKAELDALAAAELEALAIAQANGEVVLTKPSRRIVEIEEEKLPRVSVELPEETEEERLSELNLNVPPAFASVDEEGEIIEEELEGQEAIDFTTIGELDPTEEEETEEEEPAEVPVEVEVEPESEVEVETEADTEAEAEAETETEAEAETEAKAETETETETETEVDEDSDLNAEPETDSDAEADTDTDADAETEVEIEEESEPETEERDLTIQQEAEMPVEDADDIEKLDAELDMLAEKLDRFRSEVESGEALTKGGVAMAAVGIAEAVGSSETDETVAEEIHELDSQGGEPKEDEASEKETSEEEVPEENTLEEEAPEEERHLRYKDIFTGEEEGAKAEKKEGRARIIILDILIFLLAILVVLSAIMVFLQGTPIANKLQSGVDRVISIFTGNAAESGEENPGQILSMAEKAISENQDKNKNIESVTEDAALVYREDIVYTTKGIGESVPFIDSQWFTDESGRAVNYSGAIIGTAIEYYSTLLDRMNSGDEGVLSLISPETDLYKEVESVSPEDGVKNTISSLQIGDIRSADKDHYLLVRIAQGKEGSEEQEVTTKVMHFLQEDKSMKVVEIADVK